MCYMSDVPTDAARVGVRELRQNLSVYLDRVKAGESLEVTEHGRSVAALTPIRKTPLVGLTRLVAEGRVIPATVDHRTIGPPPTIPGQPLSEILQAMRDEDDR